MKRRILVMLAATLALGAVVAAKWSDWAPWDVWSPNDAAAQAQKQPAAPRAVPVEVVTAVKKKVLVRVDLLGTVTPIASVAVKTRIDTQILQVHFSDGAMVRQGDLLFTLDASAIEAQIRQAEGQLARDQAQLEGAERDVRRYSDLVTRSATPIINLDNAKTQAGMFAGAIKSDQGLLENLKVQLAWCRIYAPISGRISMPAVKE